MPSHCSVAINKQVDYFAVNLFDPARVKHSPGREDPDRAKPDVTAARATETGLAGMVAVARRAGTLDLVDRMVGVSRAKKIVVV